MMMSDVALSTSTMLMNSYLMGIRSAAAIPWIAMPSTAATKTTPFFEDTAESFIAMNPASSNLLHNTVLKCTQCHKPNAVTLVTCNNCGTSLDDVDVSFTTNVFMAFVFGIQGSGSIPLRISIRKQTESLLVMDDLLALSPLHLNVIPTREYIPDWRYLLRSPKRALELLDELMESCHEVAEQQFLGDSVWRAALLREDEREFRVREQACAGFNYPPSQYQLHIQYMLPCFMPFQYGQYLKGVHFTYKRFFPFAYVRRCLELAAQTQLPTSLLQDDTKITDITAYFADKHAHDYDSAHASYYDGFKELYAKYSNWEKHAPEWFEYRVQVTAREEGGGRCVPHEVICPLLQGDASTLPPAAPTSDASSPPSSSSCMGSPTVAAISTIAQRDKKLLQCYGRPYQGENDSPSGFYYAFPKAVDEINVW